MKEMKLAEPISGRARISLTSTNADPHWLVLALGVPENIWNIA